MSKLPKCIVMVGVAASGKSTLAEKIAESEENANAKIFSSDALRGELYGDENDQSHNQEVFNELHKRIRNHLREGKTAIYDATNLNSKRRMAFLQELKRVPCIKKAIVVLCPYNDAIIHNASRERQVPADVIKKHNGRIETINLNTKKAQEVINTDKCAVLLIMGPQKDYSKQEAKMVKDYLEQGGKVIASFENANSVEEKKPNFYSIFEAS